MHWWIIWVSNNSSLPPLCMSSPTFSWGSGSIIPADMVTHFYATHFYAQFMYILNLAIFIPTKWLTRYILRSSKPYPLRGFPLLLSFRPPLSGAVMKHPSSSCTHILTDPFVKQTQPFLLHQLVIKTPLPPSLCSHGCELMERYK